MAVGLGSGEQPLMVWFTTTPWVFSRTKLSLCLSLAGCYLKISLKISMKVRRAIYPRLEWSPVLVLNKWDELWPWTLLFCWWVCGSWEALFSRLEHLWWSFPPLLPSPGGEVFTGKVIMAFSGSAAGSDGLVHMRTNSKAVNEYLCTAELTRSMVHLRSMASSEACLEVGELFPPSWTKEPKERSLKWSLEKLLNLSPSFEKTLN